MKTTFFNSSYHYLMRISIREQTYIVKPRREITIDLYMTENKIEIVPMVKSNVKVSLIELYLDTATPESIYGSIVCKYVGVLKQTEDFKRITIMENTSRDKGSIFFLSVKLLNADSEIFDIQYSVIDAKKIKRKYCVIMSLITVGIPFAFLAAVAFFNEFNFLAFLILLAQIFIITIPGIKKQRDFIKKCNDSFAHKLLTLPVEEKHEVDRLLETMNTISLDKKPKQPKTIDNIILKIRGFIGLFKK